MRSPPQSSLVQGQWGRPHRTVVPPHCCVAESRPRLLFVKPACGFGESCGCGSGSGLWSRRANPRGRSSRGWVSQWGRCWLLNYIVFYGAHIYMSSLCGLLGCVFVISLLLLLFFSFSKDSFGNIPRSSAGGEPPSFSIPLSLSYLSPSLQKHNCTYTRWLPPGSCWLHSRCVRCCSGQQTPEQCCRLVRVCNAR